MKKSILSLAVASTISMAAHAGVDDILITEMTQSKDGKVGAVEISNTGTDAFTFTDAVLAYQHTNLYHNNKLQKADGTNLLTGVKLDAGQSLVIVNKYATDEFRAAIEANSKDKNNKTKVIEGTGKEKYTGFYLNGDDGFYLKHNGTVIDRIGATKDSTIVRRFGEGEIAPAQTKSFKKALWEVISPLTTATLGKVNFAEYVKPFTCENLTTISEIQGSGFVSPLKGNEVGVEGIVTAVVDLPHKGFYLRDVVSDNDPMTSDGIFVKSTKANKGMIGQKVCFGSTVSEFEGQTILESENWQTTDENKVSTAVTPIEVMSADDGNFDKTLERYEGMLVKFSEDLDPNVDGKQDMRVTRSYSFNHNYEGYGRNNLELAYKRINVHPNHQYPAGSPEALAAHQENLQSRLVLEDVRKPKYNEGQILTYYPEFNSNDPQEANKHYIRIDDTVYDVEGVVSQYQTEQYYTNDGMKGVHDYSLTVLNTLTTAQNFKHHLKREDYKNPNRRAKSKYIPTISEKVEKDHFAIRVAGQNVLNFFNSPYGGDANVYGQNRGAESEAEYLKQRAKLVKAIRALDADVLALMEIENNGFGTDSAISELVNQVNIEYRKETPQGTIVADTSTENRYVFVGFDHNGNQMLDNLDAIGKDSITTGIIYRPSKMSIERTRVIDMPRQKAPSIQNAKGQDMYNLAGESLETGENYHRNALVVTFVVNQTGKRLTLAVNHLKSKGSTCWEDWQGVDFGDKTQWPRSAYMNPDLQSSCAEFRAAGAFHLGQEMEDIPGDKIILGDLNAYGKEDALLVLTENPRKKSIVSSSHTFIGNKPQFNKDGSPANITKSFGYVDIVGKILKGKGETPWSYSYKDTVGSLDHILITPKLEDRVIDATDWHINAGETDMYSYSNKYKKVEDATGAHRFYQEDVFRSSDHDPALLTLSYKPGETDAGQAVRLTKLKKLINLPYELPSTAKKGDIANVNLSPVDDEANLDLERMTLPNIVLSKDGQDLVNFQIYGAPSARYNATVSLTRNGQVVEGSTQSFEVNITNRDPLVAGIVKEQSDGSGGSTGFISMLSLFGLAALRRRVRK